MVYLLVAYTDHDILIPHDDLNDESFLSLHGFEIMVIHDPCLHSKKACHRRAAMDINDDISYVTDATFKMPPNVSISAIL